MLVAGRHDITFADFINGNRITPSASEAILALTPVSCMNATLELTVGIGHDTTDPEHPRSKEQASLSDRSSFADHFHTRCIGEAVQSKHVWP